MTLKTLWRQGTDMNYLRPRRMSAWYFYFCWKCIDYNLANTTDYQANNWNTVIKKTGKIIPFGVLDYSLQLKTTSAAGSDEKVTVKYYWSQMDLVGLFQIQFKIVPCYLLTNCQTTCTAFGHTLPSAQEKVWSIRMGAWNMKISVNNIEVSEFIVKS